MEYKYECRQHTRLLCVYCASAGAGQLCQYDKTDVTGSSYHKLQEKLEALKYKQVQMNKK